MSTPEPDAHQRLYGAMNRLGKWRALFAGWQLGTRAKGDPECDAVRDHRELSMMLRAEVTALIGLLLKAQVFTSENFQAELARECDLLCMAFEAKFPGVRATDAGLEFDQRAVQTMQGWRP